MNVSEMNEGVSAGSLPQKVKSPGQATALPKPAKKLCNNRGFVPAMYIISLLLYVICIPDFDYSRL